MPRMIDLTGKKFHNLTVLNRDKRKGEKIQWLCKCDCGIEKIISGESLRRGRTKTCGCLINPSLDVYVEIMKARILSQIDKTEDKCWNWKGWIKPSGYGHITCTRLKIQSTHRMAWRVFKGEIPKGLCVLHKCDNKKCCNPDHLYLGTVKDNTRDALERGQFPKGKNPSKGFPGEKHHKAKLTNENIMQIRELRKKGHTYSEISKLFNIDSKHISKIARGLAWKCVV